MLEMQIELDSKMAHLVLVGAVCLVVGFIGGLCWSDSAPDLVIPEELRPAYREYLLECFRKDGAFCEDEGYSIYGVER
jgi:hypothetical protein